jgi:hypothetical protein
MIDLSLSHDLNCDSLGRAIVSPEVTCASKTFKDDWAAEGDEDKDKRFWPYAFPPFAMRLRRMGHPSFEGG